MTPDELEFVRLAIRDWRLPEALTNMTGRRERVRSLVGGGAVSAFIFEFGPTGIHRQRCKSPITVTWERLFAHGDALPPSIRSDLLGVYQQHREGTPGVRQALDRAVAAAMTPPEHQYLDLLELLEAP